MAVAHGHVSLSQPRFASIEQQRAHDVRRVKKVGLYETIVTPSLRVQGFDRSVIMDKVFTMCNHGQGGNATPQTWQAASVYQSEEHD